MPIEWLNYGDQELGKNSKNYTLTRRYFLMLYYAILDLGNNEFGPVNEVEMVFLAITMTLSAVFNALIFGDVAGLVSQLSMRDTRRQQNLDEANSVMQQMELEEDSQAEIREFMQKTMATKEKQDEFDIFFSIIAPSLKQKCQDHMFLEILKVNRPIS